MSRVVVVSNAASGGASDETLREVTDALRSFGDVREVGPSDRDRFDEEVRREVRVGDTVVSAGGDGTFHCVINALGDRLDDLNFVVLPMGTGNDFARTLGLDEDPIKCVADLTRATPREFDVGRVRGPRVDRLFINACMGGFPVAVNKAIDEDLKKKIGALAFWAGGLKAASDLPRFEVEVDGKRYDDCVAVGVGNGTTAGGGIRVFPDADPSDGRLDLCALTVASIASGLKLAVDLKRGEHVDDEDAHVRRGTRFEVTSIPPMEFNCDGDLVDLRTPVTFEIHKKIRILVCR
ncbi:MAG: diacylglycerol kinase family lipid kinase [Actinomycetota bacterium]|nr:diacylglycerol kinase family lipid kinase [Actinomycetota bacterium]